MGITMELYLPDTNILIYAFQGKEPYAKHVEEWIVTKSLLISAVVAAEFLCGGDELERDKFEAVIDRLGTVVVDTTVARITGDYKRKFSSNKPSLRLPDALIAATCKLYGAKLVTNNKADFPMSDIEILTLN